MHSRDRDGKAAIPERLLKILRTCEDDTGSHFPPTEIFNEGWMLRLVLDSIQTLNLSGHALSFSAGSRWYSEALLSSPFRPRFKQDPLGEGFTNADGVLGHFDFRASTKAGLSLTPDAKQFVVVEAKMFSNLSVGTKNAPMYNQAARNVACMAAALAKSRRPLSSLKSVGFFVLAPAIAQRSNKSSNLESCLEPISVRTAVQQRIAAYDSAHRKEATELRDWQKDHFLPLPDRLASEGRIAVLTWEEIIEDIAKDNQGCGEELLRFYKRCLSYAPTVSE